LGVSIKSWFLMQIATNWYVIFRKNKKIPLKYHLNIFTSRGGYSSIVSRLYYDYFYNISVAQRSCELLPSLGIHLKLSHLNLLLWNHWTKLNQIWLGWSLDGPFSKLCLMVIFRKNKKIPLKYHLNIFTSRGGYSSIVSRLYYDYFYNISVATYILIFIIPFTYIVIPWCEYVQMIL
jgi:hypothetical protein